MDEHIVKVQPRDMEALRAWLVRPNGSHGRGRVTFEAVEDGGILVRTQPFRPGDVLSLEELGTA